MSYRQEADFSQCGREGLEVIREICVAPGRRLHTATVNSVLYVNAWSRGICFAFLSERELGVAFNTLTRATDRRNGVIMVLATKLVIVLCAMIGLACTFNSTYLQN